MSLERTGALLRRYSAPHQLYAGARYTDDTGHVWVVAEPPSILRQGKVVTVRFKVTDDPATDWRQVVGGA